MLLYQKACHKEDIIEVHRSQHERSPAGQTQVSLSTKMNNGNRDCRPLNARGMNLDSIDKNEELNKIKS